MNSRCSLENKKNAATKKRVKKFDFFFPLPHGLLLMELESGSKRKRLEFAFCGIELILCWCNCNSNQNDLSLLYKKVLKIWVDGSPFRLIKITSCFASKLPQFSSILCNRHISWSFSVLIELMYVFKQLIILLEVRNYDGTSCKQLMQYKEHLLHTII